MTPEEIVQAAESLSSFDGGLLHMVGGGDDMLEFRGKGSSMADQGTDQFSYIITNAAAAVRTSRLFTPIAHEYPTQYPGLVVTGAFNDINGDAGLSAAAGGQSSIETFFYYVYQNPTRLTHIRVQSNVNTQLTFDMTFNVVNPYKTPENVIIHPSNEINQNTFNQNIAVFAVNEQLDYLKDFQYKIAPLSQNTITFFMGTELNSAASLNKKYKRASAIIQTMPAAVNKMNAANKLKRLG